MSVGIGNISLQDVANEIYSYRGSYVDYSDKNLTQMFTDATGSFNSTYVGAKDRLSCFKGYNHSLIPLVYDCNGNPYQPIRIGSQVWLSSDFIGTYFFDTTTIYEATSATDFYNHRTEPSLLYNYSTDYYHRHSYYNSLVVSSAHTLIAGYHVPSLDDLDTLATILGGASTAGADLKKIGTTGSGVDWNTPNVGPNSRNRSGFDGEGQGYISVNSQYYLYANMHFWLMYTEMVDGVLYYRRGTLQAANTIVSYLSLPYHAGTVIRLIKD